MGRPRKPLDKKEEEIVDEAYALYRFGTRMLEPVVRKVFKTRISHNRIHMYLKAAGLAHEGPNKKKQCKWVRYERKLSLSAGHIDWHESGWSDLNVCVIIDDASMMILAGGEFSMRMIGIISSLDVVKATSIPRTVNWLWINLWKGTGGSVQ